MIAVLYSPFSNIKKDSREKAEKVVKDPNIPTWINNLILSLNNEPWDLGW